MSLGDILAPWYSIVSALADTLIEFSGYVMTRADGLHAAGVTTLTVDSTDRFPATGTLIINGEYVLYTGLTVVTFTGITDVDGGAGLPSDVADRAIVTDYSRTTSQIDDLRASFLVTTAEDVELDVLGRNYGLTRPRGVSHAQWRELLKALIYIEGQTIYACEQVLDVIWGVGNYDLYEDMESVMHTVYVRIPYGTGTTYLGRTWLAGLEAQASTGTYTVDVDYAPLAIYGVWDSADVLRAGTNYAYEDLAVTSALAFPQTLTSVGLWTAADEGKPVVIDNFLVDTYWVLYTYVDANDMTLRWVAHQDGTTDTAENTTFRTDEAWFPEWINGSTVSTELVITSGLNAGTYNVISRTDSRTIIVSGPLVTDTDVEWYLQPDLPSAGGRTANLPRATAVSKTITTPTSTGALPANVLVDYTIVPSAQILPGPSTDGEPQAAAYLWDDGAITQQVLDLITASGVVVVVIPE